MVLKASRRAKSVAHEQEAEVVFNPEVIKERRQLLVCILISLFAIQTVNMNVSTIVPNYVNDHHKQLNELHVAFIMT